MDESTEKKGRVDLGDAEKASCGAGNGAGSGSEEDHSIPGDDLRNASYVVLFIAAVFIVTAMETGSYRTPWPVAIVVSIAGLALFIWSFLQKKKEKS
ncbi:MAG: hypothetical protein KKG47_00675 [Proteobacteria bacterium]|nr:hypothetical protein [Pseudomonadota bacterium]MBU1737253.1 hypothetical protein [Pseudomonadota bacterium]